MENNNEKKDLKDSRSLLQRLNLKPFLKYLQLVFSVFFICLATVFASKINAERKNVVLPGNAVQTIEPVVIEPGQEHPPYVTNPPTSGWYSEYNTRDGVHLDPLSDEKIVEALAKGFVVITYNCNYNSSAEKETDFLNQTGTLPALAGKPVNTDQENSLSPQAELFLKKIELQNLRCASTFIFLQDIVNQKGKNKLILTPHATQDSRIALASWGRLEKMNLLDRKKVEAFIDAFRKIEK